MGLVRHTSTASSDSHGKLLPVMVALTLQQGADIGQIAAPVIIAISVCFLWYQLKQQNTDSSTGLTTDMTRLIASVGRAFVDYPEMRRYFYEGVTPDDIDYPRAQAFAVSLAGTMDHVAAHFANMDGPTRVAWKRYFSDIYDHSPVFKEHLKAHRYWYGPEFREYFDIAHPD